MKIQKGMQQSVLRRDVATSGTADVNFETLSDSLLVTLFAEVLTGSLTVDVYGITVGGPADSTPAQEVKLLSFPVITAPSSELLIQSAAAVTQRLRVKASWTGAAKFDVQARGIDGGTSKSQIITANEVVTEQKTVNVAPAQILIPATLVDNIGFQVRNWSSNGAVVYISTDAAKAVIGQGWPLGPGDVVSISVKGGTTWYASSTVNGADLRLMEGK